MRYLITTILLALAPLGWGEENVWYCATDLFYAFEDEKGDGTYSPIRYKPETFTLRYEEKNERLALKGQIWSRDIYYIECDFCSLGSLGNPLLFKASSAFGNFAMKGDRFFSAVASYDTSQMLTGTCTKF
jgi:hypothetical protein